MTASNANSQRFSGPLLAACLAAVMLVTVRCDPTVDILEPSDEFQFSLFGALNVAADTQIIRVEPIGDSTQIGAPRDFPANVLIENMETGEQVSLRDSFVTVGIHEAPVHNFWTTYSLEPGTSYRIIVEKENGPVTTATTTMPERAPTLSYDSTFYLPCSSATTPERTRGLNTFFVEVQNVDKIAAAEIIYPTDYNYGEGTEYMRPSFSHYDDIQDRGEYFEIAFFYQQELIDINPEPQTGLQRTCTNREDFTYDHALVAVSAAGPNWPAWRGVSLNEIARPDSFSNVEGGHGFVAGIYSDTLVVPIQDRPDEQEL